MQDYSKFSILVVDDIPDNLKILGNILKEIEVKVFIAMNGKQALNVIANSHVDLILLDIAMPEMDGYEVCRTLKADSNTCNIPIIFITARTQVDDVVRGFELGAVDYITKPFNPPELIKRVTTHLNLKHSLETVEQQKNVLEKQNADLIELNRMKDKFFSIIAHDLKNPFNIMLGFSEFLKNNFRTYEPEKTQELLTSMHEMAQRSYSLLENLLAWSRSQLGIIKVCANKNKIKALISKNIDLTQELAEAKKIIILFDERSEKVGFFDDNLFNIVFRNLLTNGIKFSYTESCIKINVQEHDNFYHISVIDNGIGMNVNTLNKLFKIDAHHSTLGTNDEKGTGLGLHLCKEFSEKNGGQIWVESKENEGSTFTFSVPKA